jgi:predicted glycosyltransferase
MPVAAASVPQKKAIFLVFDGGTGVGHLRRLAHIAGRLQGQFACLIVTGHRAAAHWFVPEECEYIHLPSWDSLLEAKAAYWGRKPFMVLDPDGAVRLRSEILKGVVDAFKPDAMFVDHLPLGAHEELADIIRDTPCRKYLVTRGVLNETENIRQLILGGRANDYLKRHYDRCLVAADRRVFDFLKRYNVSAEIREKSIHTGYVIESVPSEAIRRTREHRGLEDGDIWVVASAGGGQLGEPLIAGCLELARTNEDIVFDIVRGPRSRLPWDDPDRSTIVSENLQFHKETYQMPYFHAAADLVISSGGYNSLLETLQGNGRILCFPYRRDRRDEQYQHAACLEKFVDIEVSTDLSRLKELFDAAIASIRRGRCRDRRRELDFNGAAFIRNVVFDDFGLSESIARQPGVRDASGCHASGL